MNRITGDGAVGSQRQTGNRLTSTTVLGRLDLSSKENLSRWKTGLRGSYTGVSTTRELKEDRGDVGLMMSITRQKRLVECIESMVSARQTCVERTGLIVCGRRSSDIKLVKARQVYNSTH